MMRAALMTPAGTAGIAVIQIKGAGCIAAVAKIFRGRSGRQVKLGEEPGRLWLGEIYDEQEPVDQVVVAADSRREEVDIDCHGGPRIVQRILLLLQKEGAEVVSWEKMIGGRSIREEVELYLPRCRTRLGVLAIAAQEQRALGAWAAELAGRLERRECEPAEARWRMEEVLGSFKLAERLLHPAAVVAAGAVNVGKSTLCNALAGRRQSIGSNLAGTTRDWTAELVDMEGVPVNLIDTAGRRQEAEDELEREAIGRAERQAAGADLVLVVVEAGAKAAEQAEGQLASLPAGKPYILVVNKMDRLGEYGQVDGWVGVSALKEENLERLRQAIAAKLGFGGFEPERPLVFTRRQYELLRAALGSAAAEMAEQLRRVVDEGE